MGANSNPLDRSEPEEIRVTDRRRFRAENQGDADRESGTVTESPSLKPTYVEQLEARTQAAEQKARDVQARFESLKSELRRETDEMRQRLNRTAEEKLEREKGDLVKLLFPVFDNLRRALESAEQGASWEALLEGLRGTLNLFESVLRALGVEAFSAANEAFDPELHEAVDTVPVDPQFDGVITAEHSRGYRRGKLLLRPARVQVGRAREGVMKASE